MNGDERCKKCRHRSYVSAPKIGTTSGEAWVCCNYILDTGHSRGCKGGKHCKHFVEGPEYIRRKAMAMPRKA